jgi:hypothetical protein
VGKNELKYVVPGRSEIGLVAEDDAGVGVGHNRNWCM